ncbi:coronin-1C-A-like isoform X2 [Paramacrobiotus metropolitanus]|uniref:coronin-1C-A-like isoform X2 n=1 Tax=Paramacrobiotus metropolitanus TaxID=2943436 RepID=UPI0024463467|nr:coronin-1C-A-like isoform X2 [Paramacrobiotus metropolitanus]
MSGVQVVRQSKMRHVYGQVDKKEFCYDDIRVTKSSWDSMFCAVNPKFIAVVTEAAGGGAFIVLPLNKYGRQDKDSPIVGGHKGAVLDIQWCPFNDNVIASASDDCTIKIWQIPDGGLFINMTEPIVSLEYHQRRVGQIQWHPVANNILMSVGGDSKIVIWNIGTGEPLKVIEGHPDIIFSAAFNYNGSKIVTTCKDKLIRVIDARSGEILEKGKGHDGTKSSRAIFLKDGSIFTTGFSKMSERQYALRDETMLDDPISMIEVDTSNGILVPIYDPDSNLMFVTAKGDSQIRYFEVNMEQPPYIHYVNTFLSSDPQRGLGVMPKRGCDIGANEIFRLYKLHGNGKVEPIRFFVPRKSDSFQEDLYPDTAGDTPALSADEWWTEKKDANPVLISLRGGYQAKGAQTLQVTKKSNILDKMPSKGAAGGITSAQFEELQAELKTLRKLVMDQEKRIKILEGGKPESNGEVKENGPH